MEDKMKKNQNAAWNITLKILWEVKDTMGNSTEPLCQPIWNFMWSEQILGKA